MTNKIELNEDQTSALAKLQDFVNVSRNTYFLLEGMAGSGKAQPIHSKILTPHGWVRMGDIRVGQVIYSTNGECTTVTGVYPQGAKQVYKISLTDGSIVESCADHLWAVSELSRAKYKNKTAPLKELMDYKIVRSDGETRYKYTLPYNNTPIEFAPQSSNFIHPYILGCLLGDGGISQNVVALHNNDLHIINRVRDLLMDEYQLTKEYISDSGLAAKKCMCHRIVNKHKIGLNAYGRNINSLGLRVTSDLKFIPESYMRASISDRIELLQGIFDTDGTVDKRTGVAFINSTSYRLLNDVKELVYSLGGATTTITKSKKSGYRNKLGVFINTKDCYSLRIYFNNGIYPFTLERKLRWFKQAKAYAFNRKIVEITPSTIEPCICISVDHPSKLYITDDYILTHNTTTTTEFIKWLKTKTLHNKIVMTGPTHKSVKVMKKMNTIPGISFNTLHSLLGLKHRITADGREVYERDKYDKSKLQEYSFVVCDEVSMLSDQLFHELNNQNYTGIKVLFVGDRNQINPIDHVHSIPMLQDKRDLYEIGYAQLTKIVRQAENNPIIKISQSVLNDNFEFKVGDSMMGVDSGVEIVDSKNAKRLTQLLQEYFVCDAFDKNADHCRVVAWRNKSVDYFNNIIRKMKYGNTCRKIVVGEKLLADKPIKDIMVCAEEDESEFQILFNSNEDLIVRSIKEDVKTLYGKQYYFYEAEVEGDTKEGLIHILDERSEKDYATALKAMANDAKTEKDSYIRVQKWKKYFGFIDNFAQIKYAYCCTCHTAQGSTYENTMVFYTDIIANWNNEECKRILYTAVTRPRHKLYIF